jgi:hypothetical protein
MHEWQGKSKILENTTYPSTHVTFSGAVMPADRQYVPDGHHSNEPRAAYAQYAPAGHSAGPLLPATQKLPAAHSFCVDEFEPAPHQYPARHGPAAALRPVALQNEPAVHGCCVADDEPAGQNAPIAHGPSRASADAPTALQ